MTEFQPINREFIKKKKKVKMVHQHFLRDHAMCIRLDYHVFTTQVNIISKVLQFIALFKVILILMSAPFTISNKC